MSAGTGRKSLSERRTEEMLRQGGKCYWCQVVMTPIPEDAHKGGSQPPTMVTLDHLYPKGHPKRQIFVRGEQRYVAACRKCNADRGKKHSDEQNKRHGFTKGIAVSTA